MSATTGQSQMAAQHRAAITIYEFMDEMEEISVQAGEDRDIAEKLAEALIRIARELRKMSAELAADDNIVKEVVDAVADLADSAADMAAQAVHFAQSCKTAAEHAFTAYRWVNQVYGEDVQAMSASGLSMASAASHH